MNMKKHRFFFHYRKTTDGMTVHYKKRCISCKNVICNVPVETKRNKQQPKLVLQGFASTVLIDNDIVTIQ